MDEMKKEGLEQAQETSEPQSQTMASEEAAVADMPAVDNAEAEAQQEVEAADEEAELAPVQDEEEGIMTDTRGGRVRKYRYHMGPDEYYEALMAVELASGKHRLYRNVAIVVLLGALMAALDMILSRNLFAMIATGALSLMGVNIRNTDKRSARKGASMAGPNGTTFSLDLKKHGLSVSDGTNKAMLMPYSIFKKGYETPKYLSLVTVKNTSLNIKRDDQNPSYRAIRDRFIQELGEHFHADNTK